MISKSKPETTRICGNKSMPAASKSKSRLFDDDYII